MTLDIQLEDLVWFVERLQKEGLTNEFLAVARGKEPTRPEQLGKLLEKFYMDHICSICDDAEDAICAMFDKLGIDY